MKTLFVGAAALLGMAVQAHSASVPATYAPSAYVSGGYYAEGVTASIPGQQLSPFAGTTADGRPYDVVYGNNSDPFEFGVPGVTTFYTADAFAGSNGSAGVFKFLDGSPDSYNELLFYNSDTGSVNVLVGSQIATVTGSGYQVVTLTNLGAYDFVGFGSVNQNAFEYAALSAVPLPASAPMFGAGLLALGAVGYGLKRKKAAATA